MIILPILTMPGGAGIVVRFQSAIPATYLFIEVTVLETVKVV
jgi:hypothetical protein